MQYRFDFSFGLEHNLLFIRVLLPDLMELFDLLFKLIFQICFFYLTTVWLQRIFIHKLIVFFLHIIKLTSHYALGFFLYTFSRLLLHFVNPQLPLYMLCLVLWCFVNFAFFTVTDSLIVFVISRLLFKISQHILVLVKFNLFFGSRFANAVIHYSQISYFSGWFKLLSLNTARWGKFRVWSIG